MIVRFATVLLLAGAMGGAACGNEDSDSSTAPSTTALTTPASSVEVGDGEQQFPDIVDVDAAADGDTFTFDVTVSSPYDTPERYADAWRIVAPDGTVLGVRELAHDHASEQPFTRSLSDVPIAPDITEVTVEGRDLLNGWGGTTVTVALER